MLQRRFRLLSIPRNVRSVYTKNPYFTLRLSKNHLSYSRLGFVVSKKVDKRATVRNKTKRTFRAALEHAQVQVQPGYDMLFVLTKECIEHMSDAQAEALRLINKQAVL